MSGAARRSRADAMDTKIGGLFAAATRGGPTSGLSVVAIGGYGRGELSPFSDIDVVLVHDRALGSTCVSRVADALWYPLWDQRIPLDHAVRDTAQMQTMADQDLRAALGMLDARHVAGDAELAARLRTAVLERWRLRATVRLPQLAESTRLRALEHGELAYSAAPDLKESSGGLRDGVSLRALVATWLVDIPHEESEACRHRLLDIRDVLHEVAGRRTDRLTPDLVPAVAAVRGVPPDDLMFELRDVGRRTAHLAHVAWQRIDQVSRPRGKALRIRRRRPDLVVLGRGVALAQGEVVLTADAEPLTDPLLGLRAAGFAAERGVLLASATAARLARDAAPLTEPWPPAARQLLAGLLGAGPGLPAVWQQVDQIGIVDRWLPEWAHVRLRSSAAEIHTYTIDRHSIEACVRAAQLARSVRRPDLLVTAALLHDIGKGADDDHSRRGAQMAAQIAARWGFSQTDTSIVSRLVRHHLLLPQLATRRDLGDPATAALVSEVLGSANELDLLAALTRADALATSPAAWSTWRARLVDELVGQVRVVLGRQPTVSALSAEHPETGVTETGHAETGVTDTGVTETGVTETGVTEPPPVGHGGFGLMVEPNDDGSTISIAGPDHPRLLSDIAGVLALSGISIRSARMTAMAERGLTRWNVGNTAVDEVRIRHRLERLAGGTLNLEGNQASLPKSGAPPARVEFLGNASRSASVLEVQAADHRGLVWRICRGIADAGVRVRSAHIETLGREAVDVFYLVNGSGSALTPDAMSLVEQRVRQALG